MANGVRYRRARVYKHDAFACTCRYEPTDPAETHNTGTNQAALIVKFCRTQHAFFVPFAWLGSHLARKEQRFYDALRDVPAVPSAAYHITAEHSAFRHAIAHDFVPGTPLQPDDPLAHDFFPTLFALIENVHAHGIAVVDLNKIDNIIVDPQGQPHLLDFQLSVMASRWWCWNPLGRAWLRSLQRSDRYHLAKHWRRLQPGTFADTGMDVDALRPATVRIWRKVWRPVILLRRRMFVMLGVRKQQGTADTELSPETLLGSNTTPSSKDLQKHAETQAIPT